LLHQARLTEHFETCGHASCNGLRLRPGLAFEDWVRAGRQICKLSSASAWWLGDWLLYGERTYGGRYRAALELTSLEYKTLRNYASVRGCRSPPAPATSIDHDVIYFAHYRRGH
jgi:hypothetical protein